MWMQDIEPDNQINSTGCCVWLHWNNRFREPADACAANDFCMLAELYRLSYIEQISLEKVYGKNHRMIFLKKCWFLKAVHM